MIYKGGRMCCHSCWFFYQLWEIKCFKRMGPCSTLSIIAEEVYIKSPRKYISSAADIAFSIWRAILKRKLVNPRHTRARRPIDRTYKNVVCVFKLISSQIYSVSEISRSRLYLMWSAIYTTMPPPRLVFNVPCLSAARSLCSKLKPSMCKILSSVFSSRNVAHKPRMCNLDA